MKVSVIIPTHDRPRYILNTISSVLNQHFPSDQYEIIVVDNGPTDDVKDIVSGFKTKQKKIIYVKEPNPGLHNARHSGAKKAKGEILVYVDDDVICEKIWLSELIKPYSDPDVACVGGKILPQWEGNPPKWTEYFPDFLSILDKGDEILDVNDLDLYGCNFSVRKEVLFEVGGFNPDAMPWDMIALRGDGESGLLIKIREKGYKIIYTPRSIVRHIIPPERMTLDYFKKRAFLQGVSDSYTKIRSLGKIEQFSKLSTIKALLSPIKRWLLYFAYLLTGQLDYIKYNEIKLHEKKRGILYHRTQIIKNTELLDHILKDSYL